MAWTTPRTFVTGELLTAGIFNSDHRDNLNFLANPPGARVYNSVAISIATGTSTVLTFDSERYDNDAIHDTVTNSGRLTCKTAGRYSITGHVDWAANGTGHRVCSIRLNGTTNIASDGKPASAASTRHAVPALYSLAVNDYVELLVFQDTGGALNVNATAAMSPEFAMQWVGF